MSKFESKTVQTFTLQLDDGDSLEISVGESVFVTVNEKNKSASIKFKKKDFENVGQAIGRLFPPPTFYGPDDR